MVIFTHIIQNNLRLNQNMTHERIYDLANKQDASNFYFAILKFKRATSPIMLSDWPEVSNFLSNPKKFLHK
jgi:hypothetical protein